MRTLAMPPVGLMICQSDRAYRHPCGPFNDAMCVMCGRPIGNGRTSVGVRIDNPHLSLCIVGGSPRGWKDGCEFNVHIGVSCLRKAIRAGHINTPLHIGPEET